jgi:hypothetical protein
MDQHLDEEQIFGLAEGGLDASARAAAQAHLQGCAACRREVEIAAGYFKQIADLEPVKAPANFLANVRARLPRPSPWRAFLDAFIRPLRVIPLQVALLTILGLTAISSYLYQRGGLNQAAPTVISETAAERPVPTAESPALGKSEGYAAPTEPSAAAPSPGAGASDVVAPSPKKSSQAPRPLQKQMRPAQAPSDPEDAAASGSGLAGNRARAQPESESRSDESMRESDSPMALDRAKPAPASAPASPAPPKTDAPVARSAPAPASRQAAPPAPTVAMEPAPAPEAARAEKPRAAREPVVKEKKAEAKGRSSEELMADSKDKDAAPASRILGNAGAIGSAELPAFIVRLAPGKRIGDVVSGLKAMGADSLTAWTAGDSGGKGMDYQFRVPASMRKEIAPYLERYGKVEGAGPPPAAGSTPLRIRIRFLP